MRKLRRVSSFIILTIFMCTNVLLQHNTVFAVNTENKSYDAVTAAYESVAGSDESKYVKEKTNVFDLSQILHFIINLIPHYVLISKTIF